MKWPYFFILYLMIPVPMAGAAPTQCPRYTVTVTGKSTPFPGYTYTSTLELHKIGSAPGYNGRWQVVKWVQENTYPHRTDAPPVGPLVVSAKPQFGGGQSMNCVGVTHENKATNTCEGGNFTFTVIGNRIGPAAHPVGKIAGNQLTIRFDPNNPNEPDKVGTIQEFAGKNINLQITEPHGSKVVYTSESSGKLEVKLSAQVTPNQYAGDIKWSIPDISGSNKTVTPADGKGAQVQVTYTGLPAKNSSFGKKQVSASVDAGGCKAQAQDNFTVFFPRDAQNHPGGGGEPNWFYYWSQTSAKKGPAKFGGTSGRCGPGGDNEKLMGYYRNKNFDSHYFICDFKPMGPEFPFQTVKWVGNLPDNRKVTGIDTFAVCSRHENAHYEHFTQWWKAHRTSDKFQDTNQNGIKDSVEQQLDKDGDEVPDAKEPQYGMDPKKKSTLGVGVDDEEAICWKAEAAWPVGSANGEDWAYPGKQWK